MLKGMPILFGIQRFPTLVGSAQTDIAAGQPEPVREYTHDDCGIIPASAIEPITHGADHSIPNDHQGIGEALP
jgi:hypothetical protein